MVQDIRCPEFEYTVNEVIQGAKYRTIEDVKDAVKVWPISLRKEFRVLKVWATSTFVAKKMYGVILDKMDYEPALIIRDIEQNFQYVISYAKA